MIPPWHPIPQEIEEREGPYADFVAWERWFAGQQTFTDLGGDDILEALDGLDYRARIVLYSICWYIVNSGGTHEGS